MIAAVVRFMPALSIGLRVEAGSVGGRGVRRQRLGRHYCIGNVVIAVDESQEEVRLIRLIARDSIYLSFANSDSLGGFCRQYGLVSCIDFCLS